MPHYGEILVYDFPKGQPFPGPAQIESRIDVNPEMSEKFTLWNEGGSAVIRGNLLVLPVDNSIFYVEPVYLQAQIATMPMLTQVIVAAGDKVAWAENFDMAMEKVFGVGEEVIPEAIEPEIQDPLTSIVSMLDEKIAKFKEQVQNNDSKMSLTLDEIKKLMVQLEKYKR
jgi:hypothetical protein